MIASNKISAIALLLALTSAGVAHATPSDADIETARALYRDAVLLHRQDKLDEALARITAAYRTVKTPVIALELAKIHVKLGHLGEAWEVLRAADELPVSARETEKGRDARRELSALASQVRARMATIRVAVPANADVDVRVDAERIDPDQGRVVEPGGHAVTVLASGRGCTTTNLTVQEGESRTVDLRDRVGACLSETPAAPVEAEPVKTTSAALPPPVQGDRRASTSSLDTKQWLAIGLAGAGTLSTVIGGVVALRARSDYDSVSAQCPASGCSAAAYDVREAARGRAIAATYAIIAGLGAVAGGVTLWLLDDHDRASRRVGLTVAPSSVWMTVRY